MPMIVPRTEAKPLAPQIDPTFLAMAAAIMDQKGKFQPPKEEDGAK